MGERVETLEIGYGGPGPHGKAWQIVRVGGRVFRIDYIVTDGRADPRLTELLDYERSIRGEVAT